VGHALPESRKQLAGTLAAALDQAAGEQRGIDRADAGAGDRRELASRLFKQALQYAPGECAVRAAALQCQRQFLRWPDARRSWRGSAVFRLGQRRRGVLFERPGDLDINW